LIEQIQARRNRMIWRARRGARELDGLLMPFAQEVAASGDAVLLDDFEKLLTYPDPLLLDWVFGRRKPEDPAMLRLIHLILKAPNRAES